VTLPLKRFNSHHRLFRKCRIAESFKGSGLLVSPTTSIRFPWGEVRANFSSMSLLAPRRGDRPFRNYSDDAVVKGEGSREMALLCPFRVGDSQQWCRGPFRVSCNLSLGYWHKAIPPPKSPYLSFQFVFSPFLSKMTDVPFVRGQFDFPGFPSHGIRFFGRKYLLFLSMIYCWLPRPRCFSAMQTCDKRFPLCRLFRIFMLSIERHASLPR